MPRLLDLFAKGREGDVLLLARSDTSGKAIKRVFRKGFVKKVLSASPAASYGLKTMLYRGRSSRRRHRRAVRDVARMREAAKAGHTVGIHAWDHIDWHDRLPRMSREEIEAVVSKEHARFLEIFGRRRRSGRRQGGRRRRSPSKCRGARHPRDVGHAGGAPFFARRADGARRAAC